VSCSFPLTSFGLPQCVVFTHKIYKNLQGFLSKHDSSKSKDDVITDEINCISYDGNSNSLKIDHDKCISCGSCAFSCPGGKINFSSELKAIPSCSTFKGHSKSEIINIKEKIINFTEDTLESSNLNYKSFEKYTGIKETKNISLWGGNTARYLFGDNVKIGLEIPLSIGGRDRNGRLDICILTKDTLVVMEAKISLKKLLAEGRYEAQILAYDEELNELNLKKNYNLKSIKLLLIGEDEKDLLPFDHALCSSKVGNLSQLFYNSILSHDIKFISARGLLSLAMSKFIDTNSTADKVFLDLFMESNTVGLLSNTVIKKNGKKVYLEPLNLL
jgi:NAD-dependent dihydropyrimidine dehydrogenase PreA subunit